MDVMTNITDKAVWVVSGNVAAHVISNRKDETSWFTSSRNTK